MKYFFMFSMLLSSYAYTASDLKYRTSFGRCPAKTVGELAIELINKYEQTKSLYKVKRHIEKNELDKKFFLSKYNIEHEPVANKLRIEFDCPAPLAKVQVFKKSGKELYNAILVEGGEIIDPNYEVFLRKEGKLKHSLPFFSISFDQVNDGVIKDISEYLLANTKEVGSRLSEIIVDKNKNLTVILSDKNNVVSVFMGKYGWKEKTKRLTKAINHFDKKKKIPKFIKFTESKKIVVKF